MKSIYKNTLKLLLKNLSLFLFVLIASITISHAALVDASDILGQSDLDGIPTYNTNSLNNNIGSVNATGFNLPAGLFLDTKNHRLFVADVNNARVLVFILDSQNKIVSRTAQYVLGQPNFNTNISTTTQNGFRSVYGEMAYDFANDRLFVPDFDNNRIMVFNVSPSNISNGMNADYVLGQTNFTSSSYGITSSKLRSPDCLVYDQVNNRLFVSDDWNARVLIFDVSVASMTNGKAADFVLGKPNFTSASPITATQSNMSYVTGITYDPVYNRLFVGDKYWNHRVMVFDVTPGTITNGKAASYVLGQTNFTTKVATSGPSGLNLPDDLAYDHIREQLIVEDTENHRYLFFDVSPSNISNGMNAKNVIGQSDFNNHSPSLSRSTFNIPFGVAFDPINNVMFGTDSNNNRVLQFSFIKINTNTLSNGAVDTPYSQDIIINNNSGTSQTFSLFNGSLPVGLSLDSVTGRISGTPTSSGTYTFTVQVDDNFSTGSFIDRVEYNLTINNNTAPTASNVLMVGNAVVGEIITGSYTYNDIDGDIEGSSIFKWYRDSDLINVSNTQIYTIRQEDQGHSIYYEVTPISTTGELTGTAVRSQGMSINQPNAGLIWYTSGGGSFTGESTLISQSNPINIINNNIVTTLPITTLQITNTGVTYISPVDNKEYSCMPFTNYLKLNSKTNNINQVKLWQAFLNKHMGENLPITGYYGNKTFNAIKRFQTKYKDEILTPWNISIPTGWTYQTTRAKGNQILGCTEGEIKLDNGNKVFIK